MYLNIISDHYIEAIVAAFVGVACIILVTCPPKVAPVSKLVINWYTDFERMEKLWQGKTIRWSRSS